MTDFHQKVYKIVAAIPEGRVVSYGQIAAMLGYIQGARAVGNAMRHAPGGLPCHRVVHNDGKPGCIPGFDDMLRREGVPMLPNGRIDMGKARWNTWD